MASAANQLTRHHRDPRLLNAAIRALRSGDRWTTVYSLQVVGAFGVMVRQSPGDIATDRGALVGIVDRGQPAQPAIDIVREDTGMFTVDLVERFESEERRSALRQRLERPKSGTASSTATRTKTSPAKERKAARKK